MLKMNAIRMLYTQYNTLNQLLDTPKMQVHLNNPRLQGLFTPLSEKAQRGLVQAIESERNKAIYYFYTFNTETTLNNAGIAINLREKEALPSNLSYDHQQTANMIFLMYQPIIDAAKLGPKEFHQEFVINKSPLPEETTQNVINTFLISSPINSNFIGTMVINKMGIPSYETHLYRFYDLQIYMALVNLKYETIRAQVDVKDVESFLAKAGNIAINPYSQKPFEWDAQHGKLSTPWIYIHPPINPTSSKYMTVFIRPQTTHALN